MIDAEPGTVVHVPGRGYFVASRSTEGAWWLVAGDGCGCPAGRKGLSSCWHRRKVADHCRALDRPLARPAAPSAPVGFFVD